MNIIQKLDQYISSFNEEHSKNMRMSKERASNHSKENRPKITPIKSKTTLKQTDRTPLINTLQLKDFKTYLELTSHKDNTYKEANAANRSVDSDDSPSIDAFKLKNKNIFANEPSIDILQYLPNKKEEQKPTYYPPTQSAKRDSLPSRRYKYNYSVNVNEVNIPYNTRSNKDTFEFLKKLETEIKHFLSKGVSS
jgi:hypothetical protein